MNFQALNERSKQTHINNAKWWTDLETGESTLATRNRPEILMLVVTELTEANLGHLVDAYDDKLPHREQVEVEIADAAIRLHDLAGAEGIEVNGVIEEEVHHYLFDYERKIIESRYRTIDDEDDRVVASASLSEFLMSIVDLISDSMEGYRKRTSPEMLEQYRANVARALLACYIVAEEWSLDLEAAIEEKQAFNKVRPDHQIENRKKEGGKLC